MFTQCLVCNTPFSANEELEYFSKGTRIAFDPSKGRLWAVCGNCKRWTLAPIEERWEALEELEKLVRDRGKLLSETDNISLLRAGPLEIVRVGKANLTEEAWWRYGRELKARRESYRKVSVAATVGVGALLIGGWTAGGIGGFGAWFLWQHAPDKVTDAVRWLRFGGSAWRGHQVCNKCGWVQRKIPFSERRGIILHKDTDQDGVGLSKRCPGCGAFEDGGLQLSGREAESTLRRVLAYHHFAGATERRVQSATRLIEQAGSASELSRILVKHGKPLGHLKRTGAIALEIATNEGHEQRLLELELSELETIWREEEELASIMDGELTPLPLVETLRRKAAGLIS